LAKSSKRAPKLKRVQYGALPYRFDLSGALEILLVTTRRTRQWIIPKGWPIKDLSGSQTALQEAYEEAGVRGDIKSRAIGTFTYIKRLDDTKTNVACEVKVYPLLVKRQFKNWPEMAQREARWFRPQTIKKLIAIPQLRRLIAEFAKQT
jgi:8-oxo-dGTP pyrophosphatase MutT (NUDIX family)